ncbi:MAG: hypothetical protein A2Y33_01790 [Spirochaetes bacterium GWF1_51_8]|nr:MAG: hypothetical protein A2Y33_01790 [Spirochaetes bacterium GWF1_51_8]
MFYHYFTFFIAISVRVPRGINFHGFTYLETFIITIADKILKFLYSQNIIPRGVSVKRKRGPLNIFYLFRVKPKSLLFYAET